MGEMPRSAGNSHQSATPPRWGEQKRREDGLFAAIHMKGKPSCGILTKDGGGQHKVQESSHVCSKHRQAQILRRKQVVRKICKTIYLHLFNLAMWRSYPKFS